MKSSHYLAIAVRLFAIMLFIYGLRQLLPMFELIASGTINGMAVSPFFAIASSIIPILFSVVLWIFPLSVSNSILKPEMDRDVVPLSQGSWLVIMLIGIGLYTLYYAIVDSMFWLYFLHMSSQSSLSDAPLIMRGEDKANLVISILEVIASLFLILKSKTISKFILRISK
jgi:hypothetical protein